MTDRQTPVKTLPSSNFVSDNYPILVLRGFHTETKNYTIHQSGANFTPGLNKVGTLPLVTK